MLTLHPCVGCSFVQDYLLLTKADNLNSDLSARVKSNSSESPVFVIPREDKIAKVGLTPLFGENYTYFAEASMVLVCRKLYQAPVQEKGFIDRRVVEDCYPNRDFHDMHIGEIIAAYINEGA